MRIAKSTIMVHSSVVKNRATWFTLQWC